MEILNDTVQQQVAGGGTAGAIIGGVAGFIAGAVLTKNPVGAVAGGVVSDSLYQEWIDVL
jgi:hypothetical protein